MKKLTIVFVVFCLLAPMAFGESITYEIYSFMESADGKLIAKGTREYSLSDIETRKEIGGVTHRILIKKDSVLKFSPNQALYQTP